MTQEPVSSCLIVITYKKQEDKLKLVEASFVSEMNIDLQLKNRYFPRKFTESAAKGTQTRNQRLSSVETQHFMVYTNIYILYDLHI